MLWKWRFASRSNYQPKGVSENSAEVLLSLLESGEHPQIRNIAEIIQRVAPDIILLNEFDFVPCLHACLGFVFYFDIYALFA